MIKTFTRTQIEKNNDPKRYFGTEDRFIAIRDLKQYIKDHAYESNERDVITIYELEKL